ncbi:hypothetical protein SHY70_11120, partial [Streptococcus suis]
MFNQRLIKMVKIGLALVLAATFVAVGYGAALVQQKLGPQTATIQESKEGQKNSQDTQASLTEE